jgi:hypothetical protein
MIEFEEFLSIIKGGSAAAKEGGDHEEEQPVSGTGAIYNFFKSLTSDELKEKGNENMPFSLYVSSQRRRMILDSMMKDAGTQEQKKGEKILNNYKKQLAERMAREKVERGELLDKKYKSK